MTIYLGATEINKIYIGATEINEIDLGETEVYGSSWDSITTHPTLSTGLQAYYSLESASGTDLVAGTYTLANAGATNGGAGIISNCTAFATNDYMHDTTDAFISNTSGSLSLWVKVTDHTVWETFMSYGKSGSEFRIGFQNSVFKAYLYDASGWSYICRLNAFAVSDATWYHVVFTYNVTGAVKTFYINGTSQTITYEYGSAAVAEWWNVLDAGAIIKLGVNPDANAYLTGSLDETGIWNKVLTQSEVTDLYNTGSGLKYT